MAKKVKKSASFFSFESFCSSKPSLISKVIPKLFKTFLRPNSCNEQSQKTDGTSHMRFFALIFGREQDMKIGVKTSPIHQERNRSESIYYTRPRTQTLFRETATTATRRCSIAKRNFVSLDFPPKHTKLDRLVGCCTLKFPPHFMPQKKKMHFGFHRQVKCSRNLTQVLGATSTYYCC